MSETAVKQGPAGGLRASARATRGWRWEQGGGLLSAPVRCKREQWYVARGQAAPDMAAGRAEFVVRFLHRDETYSERVLTLDRRPSGSGRPEFLGWIETPDDATHLQLELADEDQARQFAEVVFHAVAERDPKCHPLANVPPWRIYQPPFPLRRVYLPPLLEGLRDVLAHDRVEVIRPRSAAELRKQAAGAVVVVDATTVERLKLDWEGLLRVARESWMVIDLGTLAAFLKQSVLPKARVDTHEDEHGIMSARVEYSDVPTRGFALQDVFPYGYVTGEGRFGVRVLRADRAWKRLADEVGFATVLASETPYEDHCGDVLSAALPVARGELLATDLPWLVAGDFGLLPAPRLARHALRMHLGEPVDDHVQYWNRWDDPQVVVRDISDLSRRYPPLRAIRWALRSDGLAPLGVALPPAGEGAARRTILLRTGRIDRGALHDGLPPEPLIVFMKMLARDRRDASAWVARYLRDTAVVWQFETALGLKYVANYESAASVVPEEAVSLVFRRAAGDRAEADAIRYLRLEEGLFGDGSLVCQARLNAALRQAIQEAVGA